MSLKIKFANTWPKIVFSNDTEKIVFKNDSTKLKLDGFECLKDSNGKCILDSMGRKIYT